VNRQTEVFDDRNSNMNWQTEILFVRNTQKYVDWFWMKQRERVRDTQPEISFEWNRDTDKLRFRLNETERQTDRLILFCLRALNFSFGRSSQVRWPQDICFQFRAARATDNSNKNYVEVKNKNYWNILENFLTKSFITKQSTWSN
jgi:hypothetical protein